MNGRLNTFKSLILLLTALLLSGCGGGGSTAGTSSGDGLASLSLRLDTSAIPRLNQADGSTPDTIVIEILNPENRVPVHPTSTFSFSGEQGFQTFLVSNVTPGTHIVRIEIYDSTGALFFAGEQVVTLLAGSPTAVQFVIPLPDGDDGDDLTEVPPSPAFLCVDNADDEQGQPDVDVTDDGYFFVVARVTDATVVATGNSFDTYGFIHAERFQTSFDGNLPTSIDDNNGNNGDFDVCQFSTLEALDPGSFDQQAVNPRISLNDSKAAVVAWLDSNPSESAGGVFDSDRDPIIRSVILGPDSITSPNTDGFIEPEFDTPENAVPNIAGPSTSLLRSPSVSITNLLGANATIDYAFFDAVSQAPRYTDGGASSAFSSNGDAPQPAGASTLTATFSAGLSLSVTNRKNDNSTAVVAGGSDIVPDQVLAQLVSPSNPAPGTLIVNQGQPSEQVGEFVKHVECDWFEGGVIVFVYTVLDNDVNGGGLYARCFDVTLSTPIGDEIEIAPPEANIFNDFGDMSVVESDGTFLVTWSEINDGSNESRVLLQRFDCTDGSRTPASPIDVAAGQSVAIAGKNSLSRVAATRDGHAVVAWQTGEALVDTVNVRALARVYPESSTD